MVGLPERLLEILFDVGRRLIEVIVSIIGEVSIVIMMDVSGAKTGAQSWVFVVKVGVQRRVTGSKGSYSLPKSGSKGKYPRGLVEDLCYEAAPGALLQGLAMPELAVCVRVCRELSA